MQVDFDHVIVTHTNWKNRFRSHIKGQETLVASEVAADTKCELGKWLYSEGKKYVGREEFDKAIEAHAKFHEVAARVVQESRGRLPAECEKLVSLNSDFGQASSSCVAALAALRDAVKNWD